MGRPDRSSRMEWSPLTRTMLPHGVRPMVETRTLLGKIAALRQRLDQAQGLVKEAGSAAVAMLSEQTGPPERVSSLEQQVATGEEHDVHLAALLRPITALVEERQPLPRQITSRGRRTLERGRTLLHELRELASAFAALTDEEIGSGERDIPTLPR